MSHESIIAEVIEAARSKAEAADTANKEAARGTPFAPPKVGVNVIEKFIRAEVENRVGPLVDSAVAEAVAGF